jgi:hypothetical protein
MATKNITEVTGEVFGLLSPLSPEDRKRVINAVFALLGDPVPSGASATADKGKAGASLPEGLFGAKTRVWLAQHHLTKERLERVFYFQDGRADIHLTTVAGASKREQTPTSKPTTRSLPTAMPSPCVSTRRLTTRTITPRTAVNWGIG